MTGDQRPAESTQKLTQRLNIDFALQAAGLGVWELDPVTRQVLWDDRCRELFGLKKDNYLPYEQAIQHIHAGDVDRVNRAVQWAMNPESDGMYDEVYRTIGADDARLRWVRFSGKAYFTESGQVYRFAGIAQDVTHQKLAEQREAAINQEASRQQRIYEAITATTPDLMYVFDLNYRFIYANQALLDMWGSTWEKSIGKGLLENGYEPWHAQMHEREIDQVVATRQSIRGEVSFPHATLGKRIYDYVFAPVLNERGEVEVVAGTTRDVTERKHTEEALRESEERYRKLSAELEERVKARTRDLSQANADLKRSNDNLQQFAYVASHDLQEPLRKIQSFSSLLSQQLDDKLDDPAKDHLQRITAAGARMSTLIKDLLAYSRISTRQQAFGPASLEAIVAGVLNTLELEISQSGAQISVDTLPVVKGDESQLNQLFQNLLTNALKFRNPGQAPRIRIAYVYRSISELPPGLKLGADVTFFHQIIVQDNGIGFDEKYADRIFQVFQRLHGRNEYPGTGVGLAICQRVVENHGGAITARSQPEQGAEFSVFLPE